MRTKYEFMDNAIVMKITCCNFWDDSLSEVDPIPVPTRRCLLKTNLVYRCGTVELDTLFVDDRDEKGWI